MPVITLPDGSQKQFDKAISVAEVAASIGAGLAKAALAGKVNGKLVDTSYVIEGDAEVRIITERDAEALEVIRHSSAHVLAQAVKELFPTAQVTIGPVIENGFYYDFAFGRSFTPEDLSRIEDKMDEVVKRDFQVTRKVVSRDEALKYFKSIGEMYKAQIIEAIPAEETLTMYQQGDFIDLCRGPHVPSTGKIKAFKLTKVAGAYWRGDSKNEMLQRIYGTAWADKKTLETYLKNLEEAEKRDHRKIAKNLDLFHMQEDAPGMIFWHANGLSIYNQIKSYISQKIKQDGYEEVVTPQVVELELWKRSGHWDMFKDGMFVVELEKREYAIKPMNCPCHIQIYNQGLRSYRELPLRLAEFGCVHRNEPSGAMHGLMRARQFTQDDAHIFCTESQIQDEALRAIRLILDVYADFGFTDLIVKLAARPTKRLGSDEVWDHAEQALGEALRHAGLTYEVLAGEGAFYGPKIEFHLKDCIGRTWQCGTLQLDYSMPGRLDASYIAEDNSKKVPVMLHRAILGSLERFIGILIEHYAGKMPVWLAPTQVMAMTIADRHAPYAEKVTEFFKNQGIRAKSDLRNEKIGFKIREHTLQYVPYLLVIGDSEVEEEQVSLRTQDGQDLGKMSLQTCLDMIQTSIAQRSRVN